MAAVRGHFLVRSMPRKIEHEKMFST